MTLVRLPLVDRRRVVDHFGTRVQEIERTPLRARALDVLQINVGARCNQACKHCHVDAGPNRTEQMDAHTVDLCLAAVRRLGISTVDITGGAPELNPEFRRLVEQARAAAAAVIVRHNFTVMFEPGQDDLPEFFAAHDVRLVCSLPHYLDGPTDRQRGHRVFERSIAALRRLNALGYGTGRADRPLDLVHNPAGAVLPGNQKDLERDFRDGLGRHGVKFDQLLVLTNMPIRRFRDWLMRTGQLEEYKATLAGAFNPATLAQLMCRSMISVSYDGRLFDCDFNQMLELDLAAGPATIEQLDERFAERSIATQDHCFGCTAGAGSSCGGALT